MKALIPILVLATAVSSFAATGRVPGMRRTTPPCPSLAQSDLQAGYAGATSGCSSSSSKQCQSGEAIAFTATIPAAAAACGSYSFSWNFGDGTSAAGTSVTHTFSSAATFSVTVTVSNAKQTLASSMNVPVVVPTPANRVTNGTFNSNLAGWFFDGALPGGQGGGDVAWSNADYSVAANPVASGSMHITSIWQTARAFQQVQCVAITPGERYTYGTDAQYSDGPGVAAITVVEFASNNCTGSTLPFSVNTIGFSGPQTWRHFEQTATASSSAHSGYVFLAAQAASAGTAYNAWFDNVFVRSAQ